MTISPATGCRAITPHHFSGCGRPASIFPTGMTTLPGICRTGISITRARGAAPSPAPTACPPAKKASGTRTWRRSSRNSRRSSGTGRRSSASSTGPSTTGPSRALAIWRFLAAQGSGTLFHFEIAPDRFTEEMFTFLAGVPPGLFQFEIGIQSTNKRDAGGHRAAYRSAAGPRHSAETGRPGQHPPACRSDSRPAR